MEQEQPQLSVPTSPDSSHLTRRQRKLLKKQRREQEHGTAQPQAAKSRGMFWTLAGLLVVGMIVAVIVGASTGNGDDTTGKTDITAKDPDAWVRGTADAEVVLIEYSDFQCPACKSATSFVDDVLTKYGDRIRFEYRHFPLVRAHLNSTAAAKAAEAAGKQGKFWEMHDLLFEKQSEWGLSFDPTSFFATYAEQLELNVEQFRTDMNASDVASRVQKNADQAASLNLSGTPSFILDGKVLNLNKFTDLETRVQERLESDS